MDSPHATLVRFDYPRSEVASYPSWHVLVRRDQVTAGSLVLCAASDVIRFGALPADAYAELGTVTRDIEAALTSAVSFEKINYLMLMMSDPQVHFHVIPRYCGSRTIGDVSVEDSGWPRAPALGDALTLDDAQLDALTAALRAHWPAR